MISNLFFIILICFLVFSKLWFSTGHLKSQFPIEPLVSFVFVPVEKGSSINPPLNELPGSDTENRNLPLGINRIVRYLVSSDPVVNIRIVVFDFSNLQPSKIVPIENDIVSFYNTSIPANDIFYFPGNEFIYLQCETSKNRIFKIDYYVVLANFEHIYLGRKDLGQAIRTEIVSYIKPIFVEYKEYRDGNIDQILIYL